MVAAALCGGDIYSNYMTDTIGAIILAAGYSKRYGSIKLCAKLANGNTVLGQTIQRINAAVSATIVITQPDVAPRLAGLGTDIKVFHQAQHGMGATLAYGIGLVTDWDACLVCLGDMPFIKSATYRQIVSCLTSKSSVNPNYQSRTGNPVGFRPQFFEQLQQLSGDTGARSVIQNNQKSVIDVPVDDAAILHDIDTPADLSRYQAVE